MIISQHGRQDTQQHRIANVELMIALLAHYCLRGFELCCCRSLKVEGQTLKPAPLMMTGVPGLERL